MGGELLVGVDLGGTKTEVAALRERPGGVDVVLRERAPTPAAEGYEAVVEATARCVADACTALGLAPGSARVGVGMPGSVERRTGHVKNSNTTCLNGRPFRADVERRLGRRLAWDNDANCFALAEARLGAARAHARGVVFGVILGTGVGAGLVLHGEPWPGLQGIAGEWGHHAVFEGRGEPCYCGQRGCLETFASGVAVERGYERAAGVRRPLAEIAARRADDPLAEAAIDGLLGAVARGLANVIDILDPSAVVLGGGVSNLDCLYDEGRRRIEALVFNDELLTPILRAELGDSAGVLGAALLPPPRASD